LKTSVDNGLLLYTTGLASRADYVAVEIMEKHIRLLVDKGNGATELVSHVVRFIPIYFLQKQGSYFGVSSLCVQQRGVLLNTCLPHLFFIEFRF